MLNKYNYLGVGKINFISESSMQTKLIIILAAIIVLCAIIKGFESKIKEKERKRRIKNKVEDEEFKKEYRNSLRRNKEDTKSINIKENKEFYKADYIKSDFLITPTEKEFLRQFNQKKLDFMEVSLQVRLADVIKAKEHKDKQAFEQIKALSLDYVIYEKESYRILFIIELDDPSHYKQSRQLNDYIKDYAFKSAKIPFFRVKTKTDYLDDIEKIIFSYENIY